MIALQSKPYTKVKRSIFQAISDNLFMREDNAKEKRRRGVIVLFKAQRKFKKSQ